MSNIYERAYGHEPAASQLRAKDAEIERLQIEALAHTKARIAMKKEIEQLQQENAVLRKLTNSDSRVLT